MKYLPLIIISLLMVFYRTDLLSDVPVNLGSTVNSKCDEIAPVMSPDGNTLYFSRAQCEGNVGGDDIWFTTKNEDGTWSTPVNIGAPLNDKYNNFVSSVSSDGNMLVLGSIYDTTKQIREGVSISYKIANGWSTPQPIIIEDYYNASDQNGFYMSPYMDALLMTIKREDSYGKKDIYVSFPKSGGKWSAPKNIGPVVNSSGDEMTPYLAPDGISLYFSTDGREDGHGNADVYVTRRLDDTWLNWSEPENLGATINTKDWDAYYKVSATGDYAYFSSTENSYGGSDIYQIAMPKKYRPQIIALLKGRVINAKTKVPIEAEIHYTNLIKGSQAGIANSEPSTGEYTFTLPAFAEYSFEARKEDFFSYAETVDLSEVTEYIEIDKNIELIPLIDSILFMPSTFFETGIYKPNQEALSNFGRIAAFLSKHPEYLLELHGHADDIGNENLNMRLSRKRAEQTKEHLVIAGAPADRIIIKEFGEDLPITSNSTPEGRQLNRRVEYYLKSI